jgi:uroporphyrinogen decarboxylase
MMIKARAMQDLFLNTVSGQKFAKSPIWLMRQAGRYMPEYRAVRSKFKDFVEFCLTPEAACEVTLQPIAEFGLDAAIIFSDILIISHAMGAEVWFEQNHGPKLSTIRSESDLLKLPGSVDVSVLQKVQEAIKLTKANLNGTPLIGFIGSPWTIASYMIEGGGTKEYLETKKMMFAAPALFQSLLDKIIAASVMHLSMQIQAGVDAVMLFDSWAGEVPACKFNDVVYSPNEEIIKQIKVLHPAIPVILFARKAGVKLRQLVSSSADVLAIDQFISMSDAVSLTAGKSLQGNLDNQLLATDIKLAIAEARHIMDACKNIPHVFNLGHGVLPHTPVDHVRQLVDFVKSYES